MAYFLNRERMRVVEKNDRGVVTYRKKYKFGDEVDTDHIEANHVENLVSTGALVESEDDLRERRMGQGPVPGSLVAGAATGPSADHAEIVDNADDYEDGETDASTATSPGETPAVVTEFDEMDYQELQAAAREADIPANQSAENLRSALRAQS